MTFLLGIIFIVMAVLYYFFAKVSTDSLLISLAIIFAGIIIANSINENKK